MVQKKIRQVSRHIQTNRQDILNSKIDVVDRLYDKIKQIRDNILYNCKILAYRCFSSIIIEQKRCIFCQN